MRVTFTRRERRDLLLSWLLVSLAFALFLTGFGPILAALPPLLLAFGVALLSVGLGLLLHELAHKWVAHREECHAEYRADTTMLLIGLLLSPFKVFVAAPGAVHITHADNRQQGLIGAAGPAANLLLAAASLTLFLSVSEGIVGVAAGLSAIVNSSIGLFNLIPYGWFDGAKIIAWHKGAYGALVAAAVALTFFSFIFAQASRGLL